MRYSILDMVQDILNDMDSDEVNSFDDTFESAQVANIIRSTYFAMMSNRNWPHMKKVLQFNSFGDSALPTHMNLPERVKELSLVNYNKAKLGETKKVYQPVKYLEPDAFLRRTNSFDSSQANVDVIIDPTGVELLIKNDKAPEYYTSFNDRTVVFDSYDKSVDAVLQASKVQAHAYVFPRWTHEDSFVPDLPEEAFTALLEESKSRAMIKLKQMSDVKAEQEATRQHRWLARKAFTVNGGVKYPNYGRKGRK